MGCELIVDRDGRTVHLRFSGFVGVEAMVDAVRSMERRRVRHYNQLWDLRGAASLDLAPEELDALAALSGERQEKYGPQVGRIATVAPGVEGEIAVRGPNVMRGYFKNPEATAAALTADGWLRTCRSAGDTCSRGSVARRRVRGSSASRRKSSALSTIDEALNWLREEA